MCVSPKALKSEKLSSSAAENLFCHDLDGIIRHGQRIPSSHKNGLKLFVRCVIPAFETSARPILLVHGATIASYSWDIDREGHSLMAHFARKGRPTFALDIRGYGGSDKPERAPGSKDPVARASEAVEDIDDVLEYVRKVTGFDSIDLIGSSWGSITCGIYAARVGRNKIHRLILNAPLFGTYNQGWLDGLADPDNPEQIRPGMEDYRWVTETDLRKRWDDEIQAQNKETWRSERGFTALFNEAMSWDPQSTQYPPFGFRAPNGTLVDLFQVFRGFPMYEPEEIIAPTLLLRGENDTTSTDIDAQKIFERLGADIKRYVVIGQGSHFLLAEKNRRQLFDELLAFLISEF